MKTGRGRGGGQLVVVDDTLDGQLGGETLAHFGFDAIFEGHHGVGARMAGAMEAQIDRVAIHGDKLHIPAMTLDEGADFFDIRLDLFLHGGLLVAEMMVER